MFNTKEKKERALGVKLFLKAYRCNSPKCAMVRNPERPGPHGGKRRRQLSEFGLQTQEKQKIKLTYGIRENQMRQTFKKASHQEGVTGEMMINLLERRLDNVVYRLGLAPSRAVARQLVGHGHMHVNGRKVTIPSYRMAVGNVVSIRPESKDHPIFKELAETLKDYDVPVWLALDKEKLEGTVLAIPKDFEIPFDVNLVVDYYSKIQK